MFTVIHTTLDSFCAGTKIIQDRPSVHTRERSFWCKAAPRRSQKWRVTYRITDNIHVGTKSHPVWCEHKLSAQSIIRKWYFILMQIKLVFTRKFLPLASFWKWEFLEYGNGLYVTCTSPIMHLICPPPPPTPILHNLCFSFSLGITAVPREIENNAYAKFGGVNKVHYGWSVSKVFIFCKVRIKLKWSIKKRT